MAGSFRAKSVIAKAGPCAVITRPPLVIVSSDAVTVFGLPECEELRSLKSAHCLPRIGADESQSPPLTALCSSFEASAEVAVLSVTSGEQIWRCAAAELRPSSMTFSSASGTSSGARRCTVSVRART